MSWPKKIKGIAFDLEGTVVDVEAAHHQGHFAIAKEIGIELDLDSALKTIPHFIGGPDEKIVEELWALSDKKRDTAFIAKRDKYHYHEFLKKLTIEPRPGFLDFFKKVCQMGIKTSIGSLTSLEDAAVLLNSSGLDKIFSRAVTVLRNDVERVKPAPDVFRETARRMDITTAEQLVFEDSPNGIRAARAAGTETIIGVPVYDRNEVIEKLLQAGATEVFKNWSDVIEMYFG